MPLPQKSDSLTAEARAYRTALQALHAQDYETGAQGFLDYLEQYPEGILRGEARLGRLEALLGAKRFQILENEIETWLAENLGHPSRSQVEALRVEVERKIEGFSGDSQE